MNLHAFTYGTAQLGAGARQIYELTYLKYKTGASEAEIRRAMEAVGTGTNRAKIERKLQRRSASN